MIRTTALALLLVVAFGCASIPPDTGPGAGDTPSPDSATEVDELTADVVADDVEPADAEEGDSEIPPPNDDTDGEEADGSPDSADERVDGPPDVGPEDACTLVVPGHAFEIGPLTLQKGIPEVDVALSIQALPTPYASTMTELSLRWTGPPAGLAGLELRVFERSGDVFKLASVHPFTADSNISIQQVVAFDPPLVVPGLRWLGIYDPSGSLQLGHTQGAGPGYLVAPNSELTDVLGSLVTPQAVVGTASWRAEFVDVGPCKHGGTCAAVGDVFSCTCLPAYSGADCAYISNSCASLALNDCDALAECVPGDGAQFECICPEGYAGDGSNCEDVDECADVGLNPCHPNAVCNNIQGAAECTCYAGFTGDGFVDPDASGCTDLDECELGHDCDEHADCSNTSGSYECTCQVGWQGDGTTCEDTDECQQPPDEGGVDCGESAECSNTEGGFDCVCKDGYVPDGLFCADVDECVDDAANDCDPNALCFNEPGTFQCQCVDGFVGDGIDCCGAPFASGETCEDAFEICELPFTDSRLSIGAVNDYGAGIKQCNSGVLGNVGGASPDFVYAIEAPFDKHITITLTADFPSAVYVVADCGPISQCIPVCTVLGSSCIAADAAGADQTAFIDTVLPGGFTWYIVVDGQGSMVSLSGSYTLTVQ